MSVAPPTMLPVHGFVLAGGKSSRMGRDKALLPFRGRPMVEIAVEKLRSFCAEVSIAGNRDDLRVFAPVIRETRLEAGPVAGIEAGLRACSQDWALFLPVDVPLLPTGLLRDWVESVLAREQRGVRMSYLRTAGQSQPAICLLHRECLEGVCARADRGDYKLGRIFEQMSEQPGGGTLCITEVAELIADDELAAPAVAHWFSNLNTAEELAEAERSSDGAALAGWPEAALRY